MQRRYFVSGIAFTGLAGCAGLATNSLNNLPQKGLSAEGTLFQCPVGCHSPPPTPAAILASVTALKANNYRGAKMTTNQGVVAKSIDSSGANSNGIIIPGTSLTLNAYGTASLVITPNHPVFSGQTFTHGSTTISQTPSLGLSRFTDPKIGSGATWYDSQGNLNMVYSGFPAGSTIQVASVNLAHTAPPAPGSQAAGVLNGAYAVGVFGLVFGILAPEVAAPVGIITGILSALFGNPWNIPSPPPPAGSPSVSGMIDNLNLSDGVQMLSGGPQPPDGLGSGSSAPDQLLCM